MHMYGSRERWVMFGLMAFAVGLLFFVGTRYSRPRPVISIETSSSPSPSSSPAPSNAPAVTPAPHPSAETIEVDVEGAVRKTGLQSLPIDSRVADAIEVAGGKLPSADSEQLNLAAKLVDGTQVFVPHKGKDEANRIAETYRAGSAPTLTPGAKPPAAHTSGSRAAKKAPTGPVSINTATDTELQTIPGIGPSTASSILGYRQEHGPFKSVDDLRAIKGIGAKKFEAMRQWLKL